MSGHGAPSPVPNRSASTGTNGNLTTPTTTAMVNGVTGGGGASNNVGGGNAPVQQAQMSQHNLNQIVSLWHLLDLSRRLLVSRMVTKNTCSACTVS